MVAASFLTAGAWLGFLVAVFLLMLLLGDLREEAARKRRIRELRARRAYRDSLEPQRWKDAA